MFVCCKSKPKRIECQSYRDKTSVIKSSYRQLPRCQGASIILIRHFQTVRHQDKLGWIYMKMNHLARRKKCI